MRAITAKKKLMTRIYDENGMEIPVTIVEIAKNTIIGEKTAEKDGYRALKVATGNRRKINKPIQGQVKDLNLKPRKIYEIKTAEEMKVGDEINLDIFKENEKVIITGISKGKGFAGTVKRHHFNTGPKTHGSNNYRQPGSIGDTGPQRVVKGKRMGGHMGAEKVTVKNIEIIKIDPEKNLYFLKGAVPGAINSDILIWSQNASEN